MLEFPIARGKLIDLGRDLGVLGVVFGVDRRAFEGPFGGVIEAQISRDLVEHFHGGDLGFHSEASEQKVIANGVDQPWNPLRTELNFFHERAGKDSLLFEAGARHAGIHVGDGIRQVEAAEQAAQGNALFELAELRSFQLAVEFGLAGDDDLEQLSTAVFEIAEEANFFQNVPIEVMRLIDYEHGGAAHGGALQQHVVEREKHFGLRMAIAAQLQIVREELEKLLHGKARVEERGEGDLLGVEEIPQAFEHGGFAGADLAGEDDKTLAALHAIDEVGEGLFVLRTPKQEPRVGAHVKRILREAEEGVIHNWLRLGKTPPTSGR